MGLWSYCGAEVFNHKIDKSQNEMIIENKMKILAFQCKFDENVSYQILDNFMVHIQIGFGAQISGCIFFF